MCDWCYTNIDIDTNSGSKAKKIRDTIDEWLTLDENNLSDYGDEWLGNIAVHSSVIDNYNDIAESDIYCDGEVENVHIHGGKQVSLLIKSKDKPAIEPIYRAIEKNFGVDDISIRYRSDKRGENLTITNDDNIVGSYLVEIDEDADKPVKKAFKVKDYASNTYTKDDLTPILRDACEIIDGFKISFDDLVEIFLEYDGVYLYQWKYKDITDTF